MKPYLFALSLLVASSAFADEAAFLQELAKSHKIDCRTASGLFAHSKIRILKVAPGMFTFNTVRFDRNDDPDSDYGFSSNVPSTDTATFSIPTFDEALSNPFDPSGPRFVTDKNCGYDKDGWLGVSDRYSLIADADSLHGKQFTAHVTYRPCYGGGYNWALSDAGAATVEMTCRFK